MSKVITSRKRRRLEVESTDVESDEKGSDSSSTPTSSICNDNQERLKKRKIGQVDYTSQKIDALSLDGLSEPDESVSGDEEEGKEAIENEKLSSVDSENEDKSIVKWSDDRSNWPLIVDQMSEAYRMKFDSSIIEFARFLHSLDANDPCSSLLHSTGLLCVGPLQWLCGMLDSFTFEDLCAHWRFPYDLPEMVTCLVRQSKPVNQSDSKSKCAPSSCTDHWCLWRDNPTEPPIATVLTNNTDIKVRCVGLTLFDALYNELNDQIECESKKTQSQSESELDSISSKKEDSLIHAMRKLRDCLIEYCKFDECSVTLDTKGSLTKCMISQRKKDECSAAVHGFGLLVPLRKIEAFDEPVGWRPLNHSYRKLDSILKRMYKDKQRKKSGRVDSRELDDEMRYVTMANDEADFGMGLELAYCFYLSRTSGGMFRKHSANLFRNAYSLIPGRKVFWLCLEAYLKVYKQNETNLTITNESENYNSKTQVRIIEIRNK